MAGWELALVSFGYLSVLFGLTLLGERQRWRLTRFQPWIYALSLAVYCSAWSFLGTLDQAIAGDLAFLAVYLGPVILLTVGWPILVRLIRVGRAHRITSLADFLAARYGRARPLAITATVISLLAGMPYLALQLKAISLAGEHLLSAPPMFEPVTLATVFLTGFAILLGTRSLAVNENQPGLVMAIALESLIKIFALFSLGWLVVQIHFSGVPLASETLPAPLPINWATGWELAIQTLIVSFAFFTLPRQFHVMVVECDDLANANKGRWIFIGYLVLMLLPVLAIALSGTATGDGPLQQGALLQRIAALDSTALNWLAWLGLLSASSAMTLVAAITLSTMVSNEVVLPWLVRTGRLDQHHYRSFSSQLLRSRRWLIAILMLMAFLVYLQGAHLRLDQLGMLAFGGIAQLAPALIVGLYSRRVHLRAVYLGLAVGTALWLLLLVIPLLIDIPDRGLIDVLGLGATILLTILANVLVLAVASLLMRAGAAERFYASRFLGRAGPGGHESEWQGKIRQDDLLALAMRFVGPSRARASFAEFAFTHTKESRGGRLASEALIDHTERLLASVLGATSARLVIRKAIEGRDIDLDEASVLLGEASRKLQMSESRMQAAIEHAAEGICVVDEQLRLVAWNRYYQKLFNYPDELLRQGESVADLIHYNAQRGWCGGGEVEGHVNKRLAHMRRGTPHTSERMRPDGRVVKLVGNPMPGGGFVMTFQDITEYRRVEQALKDTNETLEARVAERTRELSELNEQLQLAKAQAEQANASKSRFLAACGHDLMQPLNAARLFTSALLQRDLDEEERDMLQHIRGSLQASGDLLNDLLDMSRLDSGVLKVRRGVVSLDEWLTSLGAEFYALSDEYQVQFRLVRCQTAIETDQRLLRRIVQNFLTNAFRYGRGGKVLLGCRRQGDSLRIEVWDTGPGIPEDKLNEIFREFHRLPQQAGQEEKGLGLGLSIADRMARILGHEITVRSWPGRGTVFSVKVPRKSSPVQSAQFVRLRGVDSLQGIRVLCIDNEEPIRIGMQRLLEGWGCEVLCAGDMDSAQEAMAERAFEPDVILADFHLDNDVSGLDVLRQLSRQFESSVGILVTADTRTELIEEVRGEGYGYLRKMIKPAALRATMSSLLRQRRAATA